MEKFEYKVLTRLDEYDLNKLGSEGWELIHVQRDNVTAKKFFYLKRKVIVIK